MQYSHAEVAEMVQEPGIEMRNSQRLPTVDDEGDVDTRQTSGALLMRCCQEQRLDGGSGAADRWTRHVNTARPPAGIDCTNSHVFSARSR